MTKKVRVLLLWPGSIGAASGNFGMPQLVGLASYAEARTSCEVHLRDLVAERELYRRAGRETSLDAILTGGGEGYDVIGISVYSSYDWLLSAELAKQARALMPNVLLVAGGYHASARPSEIIADGVFDVCVVGEGERPLVKVIESVAGGAPLRGEILGSDPIDDLDELPVTNWSLLDRYKGIARSIASQTQLYLSRGCPFDCAFCMERAKRDVSWRAFSVDRAVEEVLALHRWLDLRSWTLYVADALFGMKVSWRRSFLAKLASHQVPVEKIWLLIRVDLVEDEDLRLLADANCGLGFGLESGDPTQLAIIRKAGRLDTYLDRMKDIAAWALERDVPWGANVIVGHPGETPSSIARSAKYLNELFLQPRGTTGFLSVDPFRLYPGSPIDAERGDWEARYGTKFHAAGSGLTWWHEGDPDFLSEWVDPSRELDFLTREQLHHEHFAPLLDAIEPRFVYQGKGRDYFVRSLRDQASLKHGRFHTLDRYFAWMKWTGRTEVGRAQRRAHPDLPRLSRVVRRRGMKHAEEVAVLGAGPLRAAIEATPRERFVPLDKIRESTLDEPVAFGDGARSTVSAIHAYALTFELAGIESGQRVLDLGAGTGYGTAILGRLVGEHGMVRSVEIDGDLVALARSELGALALPATLEVHAGDALALDWWTHDLDRVVVGFALPEVPRDALRRLRSGAIVVAPIVRSVAEGGQGEQRLARIERDAFGWSIGWHGEVRYVPAQREAPMRAATAVRAAPRRLPVV
jgi:protein-L-isoaspartate(D-aspartate) O-methyltransferase